VNSAAELTGVQIHSIVRRVSVFLEGTDPQWWISFNDDHWEIRTQQAIVCTFPAIPTMKELKRMIPEGCSVAPENLALLWRAYLGFMAHNTIPVAFQEQGVTIEEA
jgi:hypothetical protein